ncbi:uncharacterized protein [Rhodnius prolixus]|uniref:uncharacterized protein n=1 Tax=Rhodnius prolixus TaxID=13249 RepID=UPI003D18DD08
MSSKKQSEKKIFPAEAVRNASKVYTELAGIAMGREWFETAITVYNIAEKVTKSDKEKVSIHLNKSNAHKALANLGEARYEAMKALLLNKDTKVITPYLNLANLLFHENEYEESISKYVKGKGNKDCQIGLDLAMGTLENCVGENAGAMFDKEVLGGVIQRIKQEELGLEPPKIQMTIDEQRERQIKLNLRKKYITGRYLGTISDEKVFLKKLRADKELLGSGGVTDVIVEVIDDTLDKLDKKESALWHRKPLYSYYNKVRNFQSSDYAKQFEAQIKKIDKRMLVTNIIENIKEVRDLKDSKQNEQCYFKMLRIKSKLQNISVKTLPFKAEYVRELNRIMGEMYLGTKQLIPNRSPEINDLRIKYTLGVQRPIWPAEIEVVDHINLNKPNELQKTYLKELEICTDNHERAFLNYEIACINFMNGIPGAASSKYAFATLSAARLARNIPWFLNALFIIAKTEFTANQFESGRLTLIAAKKACENFGQIKQAEFIDRAIILLQHIKPSDFLKKDSVLFGEEKLINNMPTDKLRDKLTKLLLSLPNIPAWRRVFIPGTGTAKQKFEEFKTLRPFPKDRIEENKLSYINENNWVAKFDDNKPYIVHNLMTSAELENMLQIVMTDPKYSQYLSF